jgi:hypothetical protein
VGFTRWRWVVLTNKKGEHTCMFLTIKYDKKNLTHYYKKWKRTVLGAKLGSSHQQFWSMEQPYVFEKW